MNNKAVGDWGERYVCEHVACPNCGKPLQSLPPSYPLADVQCTACSFRAQVKTVRGAPCGTIRGAGWDVVDKVTKAGHLLPALLVVWAPNSRVRVDFYPFISRACLKPYKLGPKAVRAGYRMFRYRLAGLPMVTLVDIAGDSPVST
jgi:DNA-directed RNA polymerase subunit RPC12/RpoP